MASYLGHLSFSSVLGAVYGSVGVLYLGLDWGPVFLGAGLTTVGGLLPDIDSDSGVPVRELFGTGAAAVSFLLLQPLTELGLSLEQLLVFLSGTYLLIRYGISRLFKRYTVHRGIYHSIPAMLIAGLAVFLTYRSPDIPLRTFLAVGTMVGFLSHLVLDELCSVDFNGAQLHLNKYAASALKLFAPSWRVTLAAYLILGGLTWLAAREVIVPGQTWRSQQAPTLGIKSPLSWQAEVREEPPGEKR